MPFITPCHAKSHYAESNVENCQKRMTQIRYIDGNNLYGSQMLFDLPTEDYRFEDITFIRKMEKK